MACGRLSWTRPTRCGRSIGACSTLDHTCSLAGCVTHVPRRIGHGRHETRQHDSQAIGAGTAARHARCVAFTAHLPPQVRALACIACGPQLVASTDHRPLASTCLHPPACPSVASRGPPPGGVTRWPSRGRRRSSLPIDPSVVCGGPSRYCADGICRPPPAVGARSRRRARPPREGCRLAQGCPRDGTEGCQMDLLHRGGRGSFGRVGNEAPYNSVAEGRTASESAQDRQHVRAAIAAAIDRSMAGCRDSSCPR